jgi:hypothetical protein
LTSISPYKQLAEQALGGLLVAPALDQDVEHDPILVDSSPQPVLLSPDPQAHLIPSANSVCHPA